MLEWFWFSIQLEMSSVVTMLLDEKGKNFDINSHKFSGNYGIEETPDPIPNSEVKLYCADGTAWVTSVGE